MKQLFKKVARILFGDYSPYYIYQLNCNEGSVPCSEIESLDVRLVDETTLKSVGDSRLIEQAGYCGSESLCFGCFLNNQLVGVCFYWYGSRYKKRNFWPLKEREAKLVQIIVIPEMRGHGVATTLIRCSALEMAHLGFVSLYARIWHSNQPSLSAFGSAGWHRVAFVVEISPFRTSRPVRIRKNC
jgi:GNAT superfamily N-acetyltransferase